MRFQDREHAGRLLAARLEHLRDAHPVVLGLTRGGIPVALEVARSLGAPLEMIVVRKIRAPAAPELCVGAIAEGGVTYLNPTFPRDAGLTEKEAATLADEAVAELSGRIRLYRGEVRAPRLLGRTVVVVDDFAATGTTARAAARAARSRGAARVLFAVPALAAALGPELEGEFDGVIALDVSSPPRSPIDAYERLEDVTDEVAMECLRRARTEGLSEETAQAAAT